MYTIYTFLFCSLLFTLTYAQQDNKFQKCCGERKLYFKGDCYTPLSQGPCKEGEWIIMKKGGEEGVCSKTPCDSPIQFLKNGECIFGVDLTRRSQLCSGGKRPWYSVYGDWDCQTVYLSLPFGLISDKTTPQDPVWGNCKSLQN